MINLKQLKIRFEQLPQLEKERHLRGIFNKYTQKVKQAHEKLELAYIGMGYIIEAYPNSGCKTKVLPQLQSSVKEAEKLHQKIEQDPNNVDTKATDKSIVNLEEYAKIAKNNCDNIWKDAITESVTKWEKIADVVQKLGAKGGQELKQTICKLKLQNIPKNNDEVNQVKVSQKKLQKGIANLGLEGPFGKFLKATTEGGASPKDMFNEEIKNKMDEYNLWNSFRVHLEQ